MLPWSMSAGLVPEDIISVLSKLAMASGIRWMILTSSVYAVTSVLRKPSYVLFYVQQTDLKKDRQCHCACRRGERGSWPLSTRLGKPSRESSTEDLRWQLQSHRDTREIQQPKKSPYTTGKSFRTTAARNLC